MHLEHSMFNIPHREASSSTSDVEGQCCYFLAKYSMSLKNFVLLGLVVNAGVCATVGPYVCHSLGCNPMVQRAASSHIGSVTLGSKIVCCIVVSDAWFQQLGSALYVTSKDKCKRVTCSCMMHACSCRFFLEPFLHFCVSSQLQDCNWQSSSSISIIC